MYFKGGAGAFPTPKILVTTMYGVIHMAPTTCAQEIPGDELSVNKVVEKMRQQRPAMVQAKDQYVFVYLAVAELSKRALGLKPNVPRKPNGRVGHMHRLFLIINMLLHVP